MRGVFLRNAIFCLPHQFSKEMTLAGLKQPLISVKNLTFDDKFDKKGLVLVIWVLEIIKPSGSLDLLIK